MNIWAVTTAIFPNSSGFARERNWFCERMQISLRKNAKVLRGKAKFLEGTQMFWEIFFLTTPNSFHSLRIFTTTMSLKGLRRSLSLLHYIKNGSQIAIYALFCFLWSNQILLDKIKSCHFFLTKYSVLLKKMLYYRSKNHFKSLKVFHHEHNVI